MTERVGKRKRSVVERLVVWLGLGLGFAAGIGRAQPAVPSPSEFHGFDVGTRYIVTAAIYEYYRTLAERSPRVEYAEYGGTIQGRALPMLLVSSEQNLARTEEIRERIWRLTQVTGRLPEAELAQLVAGTPARAMRSG